jgi:hypothetical protein
MVARFGPVVGPLLLGTGWAIWHAMFLVSPETGQLDLAGSYMLVVLPTYSVIYAWLMKRGHGSVAIAIVLHAGAHLDNANRIPADDVSLRAITVVVALLAGVLAARALLAEERTGR